MMEFALTLLRPELCKVALLHGTATEHGALTRRERDVLKGLLTKKSEKQIAAEIGLTPASTHQVVVRVYRKLGVKSRVELLVRWMSFY